MTSVLFTYRVDQDDALYDAKLVTDMPLPSHGRFLSDYVYSIVSYGVGTYREHHGLPAMTVGIRLGTLYPSVLPPDAVVLKADDRVKHDLCVLIKDNQTTYYIDGALLPYKNSRME